MAQATSYEGDETLPLLLPSVPIKPITIGYRFGKRILDIIGSIVGLLILIPISIVVAIAIRIDSKGPIMFKQQRVGLGGRVFTCWKFRSMIVQAESIKGNLLHLNESSGPAFKMANDPRITKVGRVIRRFSIDELPQVFNVLVGSMSLVGPRPPLPEEVLQYNNEQLFRLGVKPGLTCLWQISGRSNIGFEEWMKLDEIYVKTMSFWTDIKIIFHTIPAVVTGRGAK